MYNFKELVVIVISILISLSTSIYFSKNYDNYKNDDYHQLIKGDVYGIWLEAENIKNDLSNKKNFLQSGGEVYRSYLPPKLIALSSYIFSFDLTDETDSKKINNDKKKIFFLFFQTFVFYLIIISLIKRLKVLLIKNELLFTLIFLCFCPSIFLYNSSYHTESIFFSLQILVLILLLGFKNKMFDCIVIAFFLFLLFTQKTAAVFYPFIVTLYLFFNFKFKSLKSISIILITYSALLISLGYINQKRVGIFYILPLQGGEAIYHYLAHPIIKKSQKLSDNEVREILINDLNFWKNENGIDDINKEINRIKLITYKKNYALKLMFNEPLIASKHMMWKSIQTGVLNPMYIFHYHNYGGKAKHENPYYLDNKYISFWLPINLSYSLFIYFFVILGFIYSIKRLDKNFHFLIIASSIYMFLILSWVGNSRYFSPSLIYLSIYFGIGVNLILQKVRLKKN